MTKEMIKPIRLLTWKELIVAGMSTGATKLGQSRGLANGYDGRDDRETRRDLKKRDKEVEVARRIRALAQKCRVSRQSH